jgi:hypothetical protein
MAHTINGKEDNSEKDRGKVFVWARDLQDFTQGHNAY